MKKTCKICKYWKKKMCCLSGEIFVVGLKLAYENIGIDHKKKNRCWVRPTTSAKHSCKYYSACD